MSKNLKSLADRLILLVARLGERATVQNITGRHLVGVEFKQAKQDAAALVVWEPIYQMRQRRPGWGAQRSRKASTTARLTKAGIWRAAALGAPYSPKLVDALIAESEKPAPHSRAEKQSEVETAALVADGKEYRRQIAARKTAKDEAAKAALVGPRRKRSPRHYEKLNKFLVSRGMQPTKLPAFGNGPTLRQPDPKIPSPASAARSPIPTAPIPPQTRSKQPARTFADDLREIQDRQLISFGEQPRGFNNDQKPADAQVEADNVRIGKMIRDRGYADAIVREGIVLFNCKEISFRQWAKEHGLA